MNKKIIITIILFIFSLLYLKNAIYVIQENDELMKMIKEKQNKYNKNPINAIITKQTMIPGINGKKINLNKSYKKMKAVNSFQESLITYDQILPQISIKNIYDKVIISGNQKNPKISVIEELDNKYCYTEKLDIKKECILQNKHTILIHKITNNHLNEIKKLIQNGFVFYLKFNNQENDLDLIIKYLKNNNYEIVSIDELIRE